MLTIQLPKEVEVRLEALAKRTGRSKEFHVLQAIAAYLDDVDALELAERVKRRIASGGERTSSLDDVEARLDSKDCVAVGVL